MAQEKQLIAVRAWGSNGKALGLPEDVDVVITLNDRQLTAFHFQCKKTKKLRKDFQLNDHLFGVIIEGDRSEPVVLLRYESLTWLFQKLNLK